MVKWLLLLKCMFYMFFREAAKTVLSLVDNPHPLLVDFPLKKTFFAASLNNIPAL